MSKFKQFCWAILANLVALILIPILILWFVFQVAYMWLMERLADILWKLNDEDVDEMWDEFIDCECEMYDNIKDIFSDMKVEES